jgi:CBS domain-containing protein
MNRAREGTEMPRSDSTHDEAGQRREPPRHSASAEAAALRYQEQHADDDGAAVALVASTDPPGSYLTPSFEHARVADAMRPRVLTCEPGTLLTAVAQRMANEHVHAIVVLLEAVGSEQESDRRPWAVITDRDILRSAGVIADRTAGDVATGEVLLADPGERLPDVAQRMLDQGTSHAVVVEPGTGRAIGVLSTLDIAGILGWGLG